MPIAVQQTLDALSTSILRTARGGGTISDDERFSPRHIQYLIQQYRMRKIFDYAMYQEGENDKREPRHVPLIDMLTVQDLGNVLLQTIDKSGTQSLPWGCYIKKLSNVPKVIDLPNMAGVVYLGAIDKQTPYSRIDPDDVKGFSNFRFSQLINKYYNIGSDYYIVTTNSALNFVNMRGVFEDPTSVSSYGQNGSTCSYNILTDIYPCSARMQSEIQDEIIANELKVMLSTNHQEQNVSAGI